MGLTLVSAAACSGQIDQGYNEPPLVGGISLVQEPGPPIQIYPPLQLHPELPIDDALSTLWELAGSLIDLSLYRDLTPAPAPLLSDIRMDLAAQMAARTDAIHSCASQAFYSVQQMFAGSGQAVTVPPTLAGITPLPSVTAE